MSQKVEIHFKQSKNFKECIKLSACWVQHHNKLLFLQRAKTSKAGGYWGVPAGKIENYESPYKAVIRELFEETGIKSNKQSILYLSKIFIRTPNIYFKTNKPHIELIYHMFSLNLSHLPNIELSHEHQKFIWITHNNVNSLPLMVGVQETMIIYKNLMEKQSTSN